MERAFVGVVGDGVGRLGGWAVGGWARGRGCGKKGREEVRYGFWKDVMAWV